MFQDKYAELFSNIPQNSNICIYGSNEIAEAIYEKLAEYRKDVNVKFFVDSKKAGIIKDKPIYKADDLLNLAKEIDAAIVASYSQRFYLELVVKGFGINNVISITKDIVADVENLKIKKVTDILFSDEDKKLYEFIAKARKDCSLRPLLQEYWDKNHPNRIMIYSIRHYFDFINKDTIKIAIDGGAYDGLHAVMFKQNFPNCEKVYAFEPCYDSVKIPLLDKVIKNMPEVEIIDKALWKEDTTLKFRDENLVKTSSAIDTVCTYAKSNSNIITVKATSIDSFVSQKNLDKVDFIKMDLENAEMDALEGAKNTILKSRPQLAISIYHSDEHFYNLPLYLANLLENYVFRLGHYKKKPTETVIYAIPKELYK